MKKGSLGLVISMLLAFICTSCAYRFGSPERRIPGGYSLIAVPVFKNRTQEVSIESFFTQSLIMEIEKSDLASVTSKEESQAIILGEVTKVSYELGPQISQKDDGFEKLPVNTVLAKDYRIRVEAIIKLVRSSDMAVLWEGGASEERRYPAPMVTESVLNTANPLYNHSARLQNIQTLSQDMMAEAFERLTENF